METNELVSLILFAYNQEQYIREAVQSAFMQTYSPLEIIISDDCSTDSTFNILREEAAKFRGSARIILNRNERNLGAAANFNHALGMSSGGFIVGLAGDDIAYSNRVSVLYGEWKRARHPVELVCSYYEEIDASGAPTGFVGVEVRLPDVKKPVTRWQCGATGAACAFSRKLFEKYGPVDPKVISEDWVYPFRAWVEAGDILVLKQPLIKRRVHGRSLFAINQKKHIDSQPDRKTRVAMRYRNAENLLGIAREWLYAWNRGHAGSDDRIARKLRTLVKARKIYADLFGASRLRAIGLILSYLLSTGELVQSARYFGRFILRWE